MTLQKETEFTQAATPENAQNKHWQFTQNHNCLPSQFKRNTGKRFLKQHTCVVILWGGGKIAIKMTEQKK